MIYKFANQSEATVEGETVSVTTYEISVSMVDPTDTSKKLSGAAFAVYSDDACTTQLATATSGADGMAKFAYKFAKGTYYIKLLSTPNGYNLNTTVFQVVVDGSSSVTPVNIAMTPTAMPQTGGAGTAFFTVTGASLEVLKKGVGHLENTAMPIGGKSTHCVLSAHSAYPTRSFFDYLPKLEKGDSFYIHILNDTLKYEVDRIKIVSPTDTSDLSITENKSYITLITCAPYSINTHRLLVRGVRVENDKSAADLTPRVLKIEKNSFYLMGCEIGYINAAVILCAIIAAVTLTVLFILRKASNKLIKVHKFVSSAKSEKGKKL